MEKKVTILLLGLLCVSISLTGCKDTGSTGSSDASGAKAELNKVKGILEKTEIERDELKTKVAEISESLKAAQTKIDGLLQSSNQAIDIKDKLAELAEDRDTAIAKAADSQTLIEKLKGQLQEQILKVTGLNEQNQKLQDTIEQLKKQLGSDVKIPELPKL